MASRGTGITKAWHMAWHMAYCKWLMAWDMVCDMVWHSTWHHTWHCQHHCHYLYLPADIKAFIPMMVSLQRLRPRAAITLATLSFFCSAVNSLGSLSIAAKYSVSHTVKDSYRRSSCSHVAGVCAWLCAAFLPGASNFRKYVASFHVQCMM